MLSYQDSLPRLPVPPLHQTIQRYLLSLRPLLSDEDFGQSQKKINEFLTPGGLGEKLHFVLEERAKKMDNWLSEWWLKCAYLECRASLVFANPFSVLSLEEFKDIDDQLRYVSKIIYGTLDFKVKIENHLLHPDMPANQPQDMSQYSKFFSSCRIPAVKCDISINHAGDSRPPQHIVVIHNNHFFQLQMFDQKRNPLKENEIFSMLKTVVNLSQQTAPPIGLLTTLERDRWAKVYEYLYEDETNRNLLKIIQDSIVLICLDKEIPVQSSDKYLHALKHIYEGGGNEFNSGNRWYDKTLQIIISEKGIVGSILEHSPVDAPPCARWKLHLHHFLNDRSQNDNEPQTPNVPAPVPMKFNISPTILNFIEEAKHDFNRLNNELDLKFYSYPTYGKDFLKLHHLSPDSFVQMALQLAYYRKYLNLCATYESASTRKFLHGRTETIRSASVQALDFCQHMMNSSSPIHVKVAALRTAVEAHKECSHLAVNGLGVDRYLLGLKRAAMELGIEVPELFLDKGYEVSTKFSLSTTHYPSLPGSIVCFCPVVLDGYGCWYYLTSSSIFLGLSAFRCCPTTDTTEFLEALKQSLGEMQHILQNQYMSKV